MKGKDSESKGWTFTSTIIGGTECSEHYWFKVVKLVFCSILTLLIEGSVYEYQCQVDWRV